MKFADGDKMEHVCNTMACMWGRWVYFLRILGMP